MARSYIKVLRRAHGLIYVEDQYLWSREIVALFARALAANPDLRLIAVVPHHPDRGGATRLTRHLAGRNQVLRCCYAAGGDRVARLRPGEPRRAPRSTSTPKSCVIDDMWVSIGSDNFNLRSWTHDSELQLRRPGQTPDPREPRERGRPDDGPRVLRP